MRCCPDHQFSATYLHWRCAAWEMDLQKANSTTLLGCPPLQQQYYSSHLHVFLYCIGGPLLQIQIWFKNNMKLLRCFIEVSATAIRHQHHPRRGFYSPTCTMSPSASPAPLNPPIETRFGDADDLFDRDLSGRPEVSVVFGFLSFARFSDYINWLTINHFWQNDDPEATRLEGIKSLYDTSLPAPKFRKSEIGNSTNLACRSIELIQTFRRQMGSQ